MKKLRVAAYVLAVAAIAMTALLTVASGDDGIVVALLGGTLAVTPYVLVRAFEDWMRESAIVSELRGSGEPGRLPFVGKSPYVGQPRSRSTDRDNFERNPFL